MIKYLQNVKKSLITACRNYLQYKEDPWIVASIWSTVLFLGFRRRVPGLRMPTRWPRACIFHILFMSFFFMLRFTVFYIFFSFYFILCTGEKWRFIWAMLVVLGRPFSRVVHVMSCTGAGETGHVMSCTGAGLTTNAVTNCKTDHHFC